MGAHQKKMVILGHGAEKSGTTEPTPDRSVDKRDHGGMSRDGAGRVERRNRRRLVQRANRRLPGLGSVRRHAERLTEVERQCDGMRAALDDVRESAQSGVDKLEGLNAELVKRLSGVVGTVMGDVIAQERHNFNVMQTFVQQRLDASGAYMQMICAQHMSTNALMGQRVQELSQELEAMRLRFDSVVLTEVGSGRNQVDVAAQTLAEMRSEVRSEQDEAETGQVESATGSTEEEKDEDNASVQGTSEGTLGADPTDAVEVSEGDAEEASEGASDVSETESEKAMIARDRGVEVKDLVKQVNRGGHRWVIRGSRLDLEHGG